MTYCDILGFLVLSLILGRGSCVIKDSEPEVGSTIELFVGDEAKLFCAVTLPNNQSRVTLWGLMLDGQPGVVPILLNNPLYNITGAPLPDGTGLFNTNLTIISVTLDMDNAVVYCGSAMDTSAGNFTIRVYDLPTAPLELQVTNVGSTTADFSWREPDNLGNPPVSHYLVVLSSAGAENITFISETNTTNTNELFPGIQYETVVFAISPINFTSGPSESITFTTNLTVPLLECLNVSTAQSGDVSILLEVIHTGGLNLTDIQVFYRLEGSENFTLYDFDFVLDDFTPDDFTIDSVELNPINLTAGENYTFKIVAVNSVGGSELPAECSSFILERGPPPPPRILAVEAIFPDTVALLLTVEDAGVGSPLHSFGFDIQPYRLIFNASGNLTAAVPLGVISVLLPDYEDGENVTVLVYGLSPDQYYTFGVRAINEYGVSGSLSDVVSEVVETEFQVPLIGEIAVTPGDRNLTISWLFTHTGGLPLHQVTVEFTLCENNNCSGGFELVPGGNLTNTSQMSLDVQGEELFGGETYSFRIIAVNGLGDSDPATAKIVSPIGVPAIPKVPIIGSPSSDSVTLSLRTQHSGRLSTPQQFGFKVKVLEVNTNIESLRQKEFPDYENGGTVSLLVSGLSPGSSYRFSCQAFNVFGESNFSSLTNDSANIPDVIVDDGDDDGLSAGEIAGIVIAVIVVVILFIIVCILLFIYFYLKRKEKQESGMEEVPLEAHTYAVNTETSEQPAPPAYASVNKSGKEKSPDTEKAAPPIDEIPQKTGPPKSVQPPREGLYDFLGPSQDPDPHNPPPPFPEKLTQAPDDEERPVILDPVSPGVTDNPLYSGVTVGVPRTQSQGYEDHSLKRPDEHPEIQRRAYSDVQPTRLAMDFQELPGPQETQDSLLKPQSELVSADQWSTNALEGSHPVTPEPEDTQL